MVNQLSSNRSLVRLEHNSVRSQVYGGGLAPIIASLSTFRTHHARPVAMDSYLLTKLFLSRIDITKMLEYIGHQVV